MSYQLMGWATEQRTGSPTRKAVLLALANAANHHTGRCHPSVEVIADETELGTATVKRALKELAESGLISRTRRRRRDGSLGTYEYEFPTRSERAAQGSERSLPTDQSDPQTRDQSDPAEPGSTSNREGEPENLPAAAPPYDPLKGRKIDTRDLVWDSLAAITNAGSKIDGSRMRRAIDSIRVDLWEWVQERGPQAAAFAVSDPAKYEAWAARAVHQVGVALQDDAPTLTWGPEGIARNFRRGIALVEDRVDVDAIVAEARRGRAA